MKIFAPKYAKKFKCTAGSCRHNCCIGWEIDIDAQTLDKYKTMPDIIITVEARKEDKTCHFMLDENGRCLNLTERGLCRIICEHGNDYIPEICREHPRFYNRTRRGVEMGIGMSCEEACRIILSSDEHETVEYTDMPDDIVELPDFDAAANISRIYEILFKNSKFYQERLSEIFTLCEIPQAILENTTHWCEVFSSLEYLDATHKLLFQKYTFEKTESEKHEPLLRRALAYFIYRHASPASNLSDFRSRVALALLFERLYASLISSEKFLAKYGAHELARIISEELEYSEDNTDSLLFEIDFLL